MMTKNLLQLAPGPLRSRIFSLHDPFLFEPLLQPATSSKPDEVAADAPKTAVIVVYTIYVKILIL